MRDPQQAVPGLLRISWTGPDGSQGVAPPSPARMQILRETLPRASTLKQLDDELKLACNRLQQEYSGLLYSSSLSPYLQALIIGPGGGPSEAIRQRSP